MAAQNKYGLLDPPQEDALHATRLLQVEERPFQRVQRALQSKLKYTPRQLPSPPPEGETVVYETEDYGAKLEQFREDIQLDFAALESSIIRIQLIHSSNLRERQRYAAEKANITETAQAVKDSTAELRVQLTEAQSVLGLRKGYDELAAKITKDKKLQPRAQCQDEIAKLEKEIEDLRQESADYEGIWLSRREAFDRIVGEGQAMVRLIKGIKDEPETVGEKNNSIEDEGIEGEEDGIDAETAKSARSRAGTPRPEEGTPRAEELDGRTPMRETVEDGPVNKFLRVEDASRTSRAASPAKQESESRADVEMGDGESNPVVQAKVLTSREDTAGPGNGSSGDPMDET